MPIPASYKIKLDKIERDLSSCSRDFKKSKDKDVLASEVTDALVRLHLLLDRLQNAVWEKYNSKRMGKNKPNIYFPITATEERFESRLQKDQLEELCQKNPRLYDLILKAQPFQNTGNKWLENMHRLSSDRHEKDVGLSSKTSHGIGFGKGQNLHIRHMSINNGQIFFDGDARSQKTGEIEGLRIDTHTSEKILLEDLDLEALPFANLCAQRTRKLLNFAFRSMGS